MFKNLRDQGPLFCSFIKADIQVTKLFLEHIAYNASKNRGYEETIERLLIIPFIEEILGSGRIKEVRKENGGLFYRVSKQFGKDIFTLIIIKKPSGYLLLSCFREY